MSKFLNKLKPKLKEAATIEHVSVITHSSEACGWSPCRYYVPESWVQFKENFPAMVLEFIDKAQPDIYNPRFREEIIEAALNIALDEIEDQANTHSKSIPNIREYQHACVEDLTLKKAQIDKQIQQNEEVMSDGKVG